MFSKREDHWNIRSAVDEIYNSVYHSRSPRTWGDMDQKLFRDAFFFQFVPDIYKSSREAVIRHRKQIEALARQYQPGEIWIKRGKQIKCVGLNHELYTQLTSDKSKIELPLYPEIEQEKTKWQQQPGYRYPERTQALEEEYVQLKITKGGDK